MRRQFSEFVRKYTSGAKLFGVPQSVFGGETERELFGKQGWTEVEVDGMAAVVEVPCPQSPAPQRQ